ncbi:MAG TPA: pectinesterase family protein, partial [Acidobacteriaceae bacterium]
MRWLRFGIALFVVAGLLSLGSVAQGNQSVPATPVACVVLHPVAATAGLDTDRIQRALNACAPGRAVVLAANDGKKTASFTAAPLILLRGVTLFVDEGVTLYASKNVRDYDLTPGSCDPAKSFDPNHETPFCKPFIYSYQAAYSAVMGPGTIDGNGTPRELVTSYESQSFSVSGVTLRGAVGTLLAVYKTPRFSASDVVLEAKSGETGGLLLSNAVAPVVRNLSTEVTGWGMVVRASILGPTAGAEFRFIHVVGGKGISLGDKEFGAMNDVAFYTLDMLHTQSGIVTELHSRQGAMKGVTFNDLCLQDVAMPLREANGAELQNGGIAGVTLTNLSIHTPEETTPCKWGRTAYMPVKPDILQLPHAGTKRELTVATSGGDFTTVQTAVDALPVDGGSVRVGPGTYREVVTIRKPHVRLYGADSDPAKTTIVYGNCAPTSGGTFNSGTVFAEADDITIENLTIENDCDRNAKGQAVALHTQGDRNIFRNLRILGSTDTLYASAKLCYGDYGPCVPARQYFADTFVEGGVDFIFGDSIAYFDHCTLHGLPGGNVMFTAQSKHYPAEQSGYVFADAHLIADGRNGKGVLTLGRAWRPYASVVFLHAKIDAPLP